MPARRAVGTLLLVSPHLDDAVLSCGALGGGWRVVVAIVFSRYAGDGPAAPRGIARRLLAAWGAADGAAAAALRTREDEAACARLGWERRDLGLVDAAFRDRPGPPFGALTVDDAALVDVVARALVEEHERLGPDAVIVAPRAIGAHVDHVICHAAALAAGRQRAARVLLYSDVPYCWREPGPVTDLAATSLDGTGGVEAWLEAIHCYPSQLTLLFPDEASAPGTLAQTLRGHLVDGRLVLREAAAGAGAS